MSTTLTTPTGTYARLAALPLRIDAYELSGLQLPLSERFTRLSTIVHLHGAGEEGQGEDPTYAPPDQLAFRAAGPVLPLAGEWTLDSFSAHLARLELFPFAPASADFLNFRRWAFESAALDLALRQAGLSLAATLGRPSRPVSFVVSPGPETSAEPVQARLAMYPRLRLKLMATPDWDDATVDALASSGAVDVIDLKGQYDESVPIAVRPEPALYRRVLRAFVDAWIEDPGVTAATEPVLRDHHARITWDAPIHRATDIAARTVRPRMINMKPSRFGTVRALLDAYDYCAQAGIGTYGGGQFELGPGRPQIQLLASMFHPDAPNDVAPTEFNEPVLRRGLPASPLPAPEPRPGFR
jgi:L-alanine-DL-glutamate epimerase-like enolase superfamily enzyme